MHTVIYHNNCYDGVTAAWVLSKHFGAKGLLPGGKPGTFQTSEYHLSAGKPTEAIHFIPANYSDSPPWDKIDNAHVYIVDFSWPLPVMQEIVRRAKWVTVLDHHKTAEAALKELSAVNLDLIFDLNRSGAGIAWDYFFPFVERPNLVKYVEDRDLWRYKLPNSRIINAYIQSFDIDLDVWRTVFEFELSILKVIDIGLALLRQQSKLVKSICEHAYVAQLPENPTCAQAPCGVYVYTSILMSEVCEQMLIDHPDSGFVWYCFERKDGKTQYGLRSRTGSDVDVSEIAKLYGGGGHKHAAGFELCMI